MPMKFFDLHHPFFEPLWRRIATVAACVGWAAVEFAIGNNMWALLFLGIGAYAGWQFFIDWKPME